jgi:hypothetical protein
MWQETKSSINAFIIFGQTDKLDTRVVTILVEKTSWNFGQLLGVVRIGRESEPGFAYSFKTAKGFEWQTGQYVTP